MAREHQLEINGGGHENEDSCTLAVDLTILLVIGFIASIVGWTLR
jgi:hypothetical protein